MRFGSSARILAGSLVFATALETQPALLRIDQENFPDHIYKPECDVCCPTVIRTVLTTVFCTVFQDRTQYVTATEHDVTTKLEYTTQFVTKTATRTYESSYPITLTKTVGLPDGEGHGVDVRELRGRTYDRCLTTTATEWVTTTATKLMTEIETVVRTETLAVSVPVPTTLHDTATVVGSTTIWVPTTYVRTTTVVSEHAVTRTVDETVYTTRSTTIFTTMVSTVATSYPVISYVTDSPTRTVTAPEAWTTVTRPAVTVTQSGRVVTRPVQTITRWLAHTVPASEERTTTTKPAETRTATPVFHVTLCPAPTGSSAPLPPTSDLTFGCKPGTVCDPPKPNGCNFWPGPPADDFLCRPDDCVASPPLANTHWQPGQAHSYAPPHGYFNLNPEDFGLSYDIFGYESHPGATPSATTCDSRAVPVPVPIRPRPTYGAAPYHPVVRPQKTGARHGKRDEVTPEGCYNDCNSAYQVALSIGKIDRLCAPGGDFRGAYDLCAACLGNSTNGLGLALGGNVASRFVQFLRFCAGKAAGRPTADQIQLPVTTVPPSESSSRADTSDLPFTPVTPTVLPPLLCGGLFSNSSISSISSIFSGFRAGLFSSFPGFPSLRACLLSVFSGFRAGLFSRFSGFPSL
ncbi:hypothetical protein E4U42_006866 [Claviceps africana]|uniref:Uncharacterized protein n=1 Tax=Claviceps africana TaxID=83212 RepID=A0A8K0NGG3_9HYPO|nr:hypothetical protein E4U42_006866 [Claviceps africana]